MKKRFRLTRRETIKSLASIGLLPSVASLQENIKMRDITEMSASVLSALIRDRVLSCEEVMQEYLLTA